MFRLNKNVIAISIALVSSSSSPSFAFFDGMASVANTLITSTESVTNNTVNNATSTVQSLSSNPGKMADRIGQMADRIGYMGDRIVTTEGIVAGVAHKMLDSTKPQGQSTQQQGWGYPPVNHAHPSAGYQHNSYAYNGYGYQQLAPVQHVHANPYMPYVMPEPAKVQPNGFWQPRNEQYSASNMIFGMPGNTYTAARQPSAAAPASRSYPANNYASGFGFANQANPVNRRVTCDTAFGVPINCR
jgi:hypothetical protein